MGEMMKIMVIGAGTMGAEIAQAFAQKKFDVVLRDINEEAVAKGLAGMEKRLERLVSKGKIEASFKEEVLTHVTGSVDIAEAASCGLIVEAAVENMGIKKAIFKELDGICPAETIFATNTSSLSITDVASASGRPDKVIGMHFFNPATVMKLVEIIRGMTTSDETYGAIKEITEKIGKTPVEVAEAPGFVVNRILIPMINEAIGIFSEGVASVEDIDSAMKLGANHPMGPLALGDLIGLDVCLAIMDVMVEETGDPKYRAHTLLKKYVRAGWLGRKSGRGFHHYAK
ncbi:3-hydroxybutyryl-CoA dehydrogenase [Desulfoluna sp.]|uniref:3-hydroxybutyryl-CoA dehydrogenase n=1 Tax=Desulfoluna sp. TaxID=2045199 RepID=UPI00345744D3